MNLSLKRSNKMIDRLIFPGIRGLTMEIVLSPGTMSIFSLVGFILAEISIKRILGKTGM